MAQNSAIEWTDVTWNCLRQPVLTAYRCRVQLSTAGPFQRSTVRSRLRFGTQGGNQRWAANGSCHAPQPIFLRSNGDLGAVLLQGRRLRSRLPKAKLVHDKITGKRLHIVGVVDREAARGVGKSVGCRAASQPACQCQRVDEADVHVAYI